MARTNRTPDVALPTASTIVSVLERRRDLNPRDIGHRLIAARLRADAARRQDDRPQRYEALCDEAAAALAAAELVLLAEQRRPSPAAA